MAANTQFTARLLQARLENTGSDWAFVVLPKGISTRLARRGRLTVAVTLNGYAFQAQLEPDGQKSHWLKIESDQLVAAQTQHGEDVDIEIAPLDEEPEPPLPADFQKVLAAHPDALNTWQATTNLARVDWIHWISSAKQSKTRNKRIHDACDMLSAGKKRVCCFDPSGFYSKAFKAPLAVET